MRKTIKSFCAGTLVFASILSFCGCSSKENKTNESSISEVATIAETENETPTSEIENIMTTSDDVFFIDDTENEKKEDDFFIQSMNDDELKTAAERYQQYLSFIEPHFSSIWTSADPSEYNIVITNGVKNYYICSDYSEEIETFGSDDEFQMILQQLQYVPGLYQNAEYNGKPVIVLHTTKVNEICSEEDYLQNFITAMHESFHFYEQDGWSSLNINSGDLGMNTRATEYPLNETARIYRVMVYDNLYSSLHSDTDEDIEKFLGDAKYWYEKWKAEYPDEYYDIMQTDLSEGTAEFFGAEIKRIIADENEASMPPGALAMTTQSADSESYYIGDLSIQLAKKTEVFDVMDYTVTGLTPLEALLRDVSPAAVAEEREELSAIVSQTISAINEQISESFSEHITADKNGEATYLAIDSESLTGIMTNGMFYITEVEKVGWLNSSISNSFIKAENMPVFEYKNMMLIPVSSQSLTFDDNTLSVDAENIILTGTAGYEKMQDENENIIYRLIS